MKNYSLLLFLATMIFTISPNPETWKLVKEKGPIKVYTRKGVNSDIKELRITTTMKAPIDDFVKALGDADSYQVWVYKCLSSKLIQRVSEHELYYHVKTDFPFPLSDRDLVVHTKQQFDEYGNFYSNSFSTPYMSPEEVGVVRVKTFETHWKVTPLSGGKHLFIDYNSKMDPAGSIPQWVVNMGLTVGPLKTMENFTKFVEEFDKSKF